MHQGALGERIAVGSRRVALEGYGPARRGARCAQTPSVAKGRGRSRPGSAEVRGGPHKANSVAYQTTGALEGGWPAWPDPFAPQQKMFGFE